MMRMWVLALLLMGSALYTAPAAASKAEGPFLKGLFQKKKSKALKKSRKHKKYYHTAAKKHRQARWNRHTMVP